MYTLGVQFVHLKYHHEPFRYKNMYLLKRYHTVTVFVPVFLRVKGVQDGLEGMTSYPCS